MRKMIITVVGSFLVLVGTVFILLPGPAFLFIPVGLGILSLEYDGAKKWLKKSQRWMKQAAEKTDDFLYQMKRKLRR